MTTAVTKLPALPSENLPSVTGFAGLSPAGASGLDHYLRSIQSYSLLTPEREVELSKRYRDEGDINAAEQLVVSNLRFVVHIARKYLGYGLPIQDLIQEGNIGLMRAVQRFDPSYGVRLTSFAAYWIKAEIYEFIMRNWRIVKVSTTRAQRKLFFKLRSLLPNNNRHALTQQEAHKIAEKLDVDSSDVIEMEARMKSPDVSLSQGKVHPDGTVSEAVTLHSKHEEDPEVSLLAENWQERVWQMISEKMSDLDDRSRDIVRSRWLSEEKATLDTLAKKYSVSIERIRQIEKAAIGKLREHLSPLIDQA